MSKLVVIVVVVFLLLPVAFAQESSGQPERYSGVAMVTGGAKGGKTLSFDFRITRFATDQEAERLAILLKEKGQDALRRELEKLDAGRINPVMTTGNQISLARKRKSGPNTIITIVTARDMSFFELNSMSRTKEYPFGFLQVTLNAKGQGTGQIMAAANLRFNKKKGHFELESFGNQYIKVANVRPLK